METTKSDLLQRHRRTNAAAVGRFLHEDSSQTSTSDTTRTPGLSPKMDTPRRGATPTPALREVVA